MLNLKCNIYPAYIKDSKTEADIWNLFQTLYGKINVDDSIIFDLTHSFRYLPMLFFSILNYAQYLKNISVKGIYYGAFEAKVEDTAPIFNMTDSYEVLQWANAADLFSNYGIAKRIKTLADKKNEDVPELRDLYENIVKLSDNMNYSRGKQINLGEMFDKCQKSIDKYKGSSKVIHNPALIPILDKVSYKIEGFITSSDNRNFLPAVEWYIHHDMPAEALSMMREGSITYLIDEAGLDYRNRKLRDILGKWLAYRGRFFYTENDVLQKDIETIIEKPIAQQLKPVVERFNELRNDIDHCGFAQAAREPNTILKRINNSFEALKEVFVNNGSIVLHE